MTLDDERTLKKEVIKLHRQFAHPKTEKLMTVLGSVLSKEEKSKVKKVAQEVYEECKICFKSQPTKSRPVVGLPLATKFNESVSMDLKEVKFRGEKIILLNMIDYTTRFFASSKVKSKKKEVVLDGIFKDWIAVLGRPEKFLVDNGGEFANDEFVDMCGQFDIMIKTFIQPKL